MFGRVLLIGLVALVAWASLVRPSSGAGREHTYVVHAGDTLWSIAAAHYGGDPRAGVWRIQQRNGPAGQALRPGERLVLP